MKARSVLARTAIVTLLGLLLAPGAQADIVAGPGTTPTFESLQNLTLSLTLEGEPLSTIPTGTPITVSYQVGYGDHMFTDPEYTPETIARDFQYMLEDNVTYIEVWQGEPFTPSATLVESRQTGPETTGTVAFASLAPGNYFIVYFLSQEIRDHNAYCTRYEVAPEDCADPTYFVEYPVSETRAYFSTPIESLDSVSEVQPVGFAGLQRAAEGPVVGISNVLFLPGIKGSRLYRPSDNCDPDLSLSCPGVKLWEPTADLLLQDLFLSASGESGRDDIYVKDGYILANALGTNFYASFVNQMEALKADGTLVDWKPVAYDWRLSLTDIVNKGVKRGDKIYFQEETGTPYIEQSLRELAASSPTGKVSIIAHSNGGLVTKGLMQRLEANGEADLVDQIIFVGVPQSGAPQAVAGLLYGYREALPLDKCAGIPVIQHFCMLFASRSIARELAEHSPMAYHLLPSQAYFDSIHDNEHPVAKFSAVAAYAEERNRYGVSVNTAQELYDFLEAKDGGRSKPAMSDMTSANVLSSSLLSYGRDTHNNIDSWVPPEGITLHQIAGWGMSTIAGVEFYEQQKFFGGYKEMYRPIFVEDGDGVVPIPSALHINAETDNVENYWINLDQARTGLQKFDHGNLFEISGVRTLLRGILIGTSDTSPLITRTQPSELGEDSQKLLFFLHSPLTLEIYDEDGNHTGETGDGEIEEEIPNTEYGEFGDVKYIIAPSGEYDVVLQGKDSGTFSLDVQKMSDNEITSSITLADVPTTANTVATISVTSELSEVGTLQVDEDGDGIVDLELVPAENETVIFEPEAPPTPVEESTKNPSRSSRVKREKVLLASSEEETTLPALFAHEAVQPPLERTVTSVPPEEARASVLVKEIPGTSEGTSAIRTQTASAYDAVGSDILNWIGSVLYNFWGNLLKIFTGFFSNE